MSGLTAKVKVIVGTGISVLGLMGAPVAQAQEHAVPEKAKALVAEADALIDGDPLLQVMRNYHCYYVDPAPAAFRPSVMDETGFLFGVPVVDNVTYLGYLNLAVYAIETSEGLLLIDAGGTVAQGEKILAWMQQAGFQPSDLKKVIVTHEHIDHTDGAKILQEKTGAQIIASADAMKEGYGVTPGALDTVDIEIAGRTELRMGDTDIVILPTPGHTPGTLSVFASVHVDGEPHVASFWGGKGMRVPQDQLRQMLASVDLFTAESEALGADVPLNTHSWGDGTISRLIDTVIAPQLPNPFLLTPKQNAANLEMLRLCTAAYLEALVAKEEPGAK